jgi:hypothetical protein
MMTRAILIILTVLFLTAVRGQAQPPPETTAAQDEAQAASLSARDEAPQGPKADGKPAGVKETAIEAKDKAAAAARQIGPAMKKAAVEVKNEAVSAARQVGPAIREAAANVRQGIKDAAR